MANSKDIYKLQPGGTYSVQIVPKGSDPNNPGNVKSFNTTFTVPTTNTDGTPIQTTNSSVKTLYIGSGGLIVGDGVTAWVQITSEGLFGYNAGTPIFGLPTDPSASPFFTSFSLTQTGMTAIGQVVTSASTTLNSASVKVPIGTASLISPGWSIYGLPFSTAGNGVVSIRKTPPTAVLILSKVATATYATGTSASIIPNANIIVGTSTNNNITIRGQGTPGQAGAIFSVIGGSATLPTSGSGFYIDEVGKFRFASSPSAYISGDGSGNLTVSGTIVATAGNIGGLTLAADKLSASSPGSYVGISGSGNYAFWAGSANPALAPFSVTNTGVVTASNLVISNAVTVGSLGGFYSGLTPSSSMSIFAGATASTGTGATFWVTNTGSVYSAGGASFQGPILTAGNLVGSSLSGTSNNSGSLVGGAIYVPSIGAAKFYVDSSGNMTAAGASVSGSIVAAAGNIGGWIIAPTSLTSGTGASAVGLTTGNYAIYAGNTTASSAPFNVTNTGILTASGANITGNITANSGSIGGFTINGNTLYGGTSGSIVGLNPTSGSSVIFAGATSSAGTGATFWISGNGNIYSSGGASFAGPVFSAASISSPTLSGNITNSGSIVGGSIFVPNASSPTFRVDSSGNMLATSASISGSITSNAGNIGGWAITSGNLTSGSGATTVGLTTGTYAIYAGNATPSSAPFSVTNTGNLIATNATISGSINASSGTFSGILNATTGSIGGFLINNNSLSSSGVLISSSAGLSLGSAGQFTVNQAGAMVAQTASITGQISASSGNIAGWSLTNQEIGTGTGINRIALNSTASPKIYIGYGNYGTGDTGFYVDSAGYFSLGNQLTFAPGKGTASIITTSATFTNNSAVLTTTYNNSSSVIIPGMLVTSLVLPTGVKVASVTYGTSATAYLNYVYPGTTQTTNTTFQSDNLSLLTVNGTIRGAIDSINPISSPTLFTTVTSASINTAASAVLFTSSAGHFFSPSSILIFSNLPATNNLNLLNYAASAGNAYLITSTPNSMQFTINYAGLGLTTGTPVISSRASIQQLTMGLHPAMNAGTSWANNTGTGVRLDDYNWWLVNNQFRVGNALSYFKYDGTQFRVAGGGTYNLIMQVGAQDSANQFAITSGSTGTYSSSTTPFYVDGSGKMSLGTGLVWTGSGLSIVGSASISGSIVASVGSVGGWNIAANTLSSGSINLVSGAAPKIYIGAGTYSSSNTPFYVDNSGSLSIGNKLTWNGSRLLIGDQTGGAVGFQAPSNPSASDIAIYAGASALLGASAAPFRVTYDGTMYATGAVISGSLTATSGQIGTGNANNRWYIGTSGNYGSIRNYPLTASYPAFVPSVGTSGYSNTYSPSYSAYVVSDSYYPAAIEIDSSGYIHIRRKNYQPYDTSSAQNLAQGIVLDSTANNDRINAIMWWGDGSETQDIIDQVPFYVDINGNLYSKTADTDTLSANTLSVGNLSADNFYLGEFAGEGSGFKTLSAVSDGLGYITYTINDTSSQGFYSYGIAIGEKIKISNMPLSSNGSDIYNSSKQQDLTFTISDQNFSDATQTFSVFNPDAIGIYESIAPSDSAFGIVVNSVLVSDAITGNVEIGPQHQVPISYDGSVPRGISDGDIYLDLVKLPPYPSFYELKGPAPFYPVSPSVTNAVANNYQKHPLFSNIQVQVPADGVLKAKFKGMYRFSNVDTIIGAFMSAFPISKIVNVSGIASQPWVYSSFDNSSNDIGPSASLITTASNFSGGISATATVTAATTGIPILSAGRIFIPANSLFSSSTVAATNVSFDNDNILDGMFLSASVSGSSGPGTFTASISNITTGFFSVGTLIIPAYTASLSNPTASIISTNASVPGAIVPGMIIRDSSSKLYQIKTFSLSNNIGVVTLTASTTSVNLSASVFNAVSLGTTIPSNLVYNASAFNVFKISSFVNSNFALTPASTQFLVTDQTEGNALGWQTYTKILGFTPPAIYQSFSFEKVIPLKNVQQGGQIMNFDYNAFYYGTTAPSVTYSHWQFEYYPYGYYSGDTFSGGSETPTTPTIGI
jgi:hypothetical protein